jgi:hypothetical protein
VGDGGAGVDANGGSGSGVSRGRGVVEVRGGEND